MELRLLFYCIGNCVLYNKNAPQGCAACGNEIMFLHKMIDEGINIEYNVEIQKNHKVV